MDNKIDLSNYTAELQKAGPIMERIAAELASDEEIIQLKELIWTITCKSLMQELLADIPIQQKELARLINVRPTMISAYKKGKTLPSMPTLLMMLSILHPNLLNAITSGKLTEANELFKSLGVNIKL